MKTARTHLTNSRFWMLGGLIVAAAAVRLIPPPPNITPVGALALLAGATLGSRVLAMLVPLTAMLLSDIGIGQLYGSGFGWHRSQLFVYGAFVLIALLGRLLQHDRRNPVRIVAASLTASALFFVVTNFGVWLMSGMYSLTPAELIRCYVQAIPFFGNTVVGDLAFSTLFFGGLAFVETFVEERDPAPALRDET
ncbi:MAG: DUF6580 family putative transport protein [Planctomycetaceae bacterium]